MTRKSGRYAAFRPAFLKQRSVMGLFGPSGPAAADDALRGKAVLASLGIGSSYVPAASVADPERIGEQSPPFVVGAAGGRAAEAGFPPAPGPAPPSASWLPAAGWPVGARPPSPTGPPGPFAPPVGPAGPGEAPGGPARKRETSPPQSGQPAAAGAPGSGRAYLAGADETRLMGLLEMMDNPGISELLAVRGGFGAMRLLRDLAPFWHVFPRNKPIVGFSDVTALHLARLRATGTGGWHAPNLTTFARISPEEALRAAAVLKGEDARPWEFPEGDVLVRGDAGGVLTGGNLTVFACLWGSQFCPETEGAIVLLEDVNEHPYEIDRLLTSLALRRAFKGARAIVFGEFSNCGDPAEIRAILSECARSAGVPAVAGAPFGHGERCAPWFYGERGRLACGPSGASLEFTGRGPALEIPEGFPVEMLI